MSRPIDDGDSLGKQASSARLLMRRKPVAHAPACACAIIAHQRRVCVQRWEQVEERWAGGPSFRFCLCLILFAFYGTQERAVCPPH